MFRLSGIPFIEFFQVVNMTMLGMCKENAFYVYEIDPSFMTIHAELQKARAIAAASTGYASEK
jgi:hypothetical protein